MQLERWLQSWTNPLSKVSYYQFTKILFQKKAPLLINDTNQTCWVQKVFCPGQYRRSRALFGHNLVTFYFLLQICKDFKMIDLGLDPLCVGN